MSFTSVEFFTRIKPMVIADMKSSGILASLTAAQAFIESNMGNSGLTKKANNLFGIKGNYKGAFVVMKTAEYYNSKKVYIDAQFRKYPSWQESISDHSAMFNRMDRYKNLRGLKDYKLACKYVKDDGYATSPTYTQTLINTIEKYNLQDWDKEALGEQVITSDNVNPYQYPKKTVLRGSHGQYVFWVQWELNRLGYGLALDGSCGSKTEAAIKDFQSKHGLEIDGKVGPLTRKALQEAK